MMRVKNQAKQELKDFLDDEEERWSSSPERRDEPRPLNMIPQKEQIHYCSDLLGQKLEVFKQIKQRFDESTQKEKVADRNTERDINGITSRMLIKELKEFIQLEKRQISKRAL